MIVTTTNDSNEQDRRIDERRDRLSADARDHFHVAHVAAQHRLEVAGLFAREQRRRVDARKHLAVRVERFRQARCPLAPARARRRECP